MREGQSRRLAAILAADIAGYSALMGADEARTVHDLKGHQAVVLPMIGEFGGRIIDTAGDGILAEFPSVVNAVQCAVAIQSKMAERALGRQVLVLQAGSDRDFEAAFATLVDRRAGARQLHLGHCPSDRDRAKLLPDAALKRCPAHVECEMKSLGGLVHEADHLR
jgi:hypothetical protein